MKRPVVTSWCVMCALLLASCGIRPDGVRLTDPKNVPYRLLEPATTEAPATTTTQGQTMDSFGAYFVRNGALVVMVTEAPFPITPADAIRVLLDGPDQEGLRRGLRTALAGPKIIQSVSASGGTAVVDLGEDFAALAPREQLLSLGQIVLTLTTLRGIGSVVVTVAGKSVDVRIGDGSLKQGAVVRDDYVSLLATS